MPGTALLRIVAALFISSRLDEGGADDLPRRLMRLLRPAESAVRRLILVQTMRDLSVMQFAHPVPRFPTEPHGIQPPHPPPVG